MFLAIRQYSRPYASFVGFVVLLTVGLTFTWGEEDKSESPVQTVSQKWLAKVTEAELNEFKSLAAVGEKATKEDLLQILSEPTPDELSVLWKDVASISPTQKNALTIGWLMNYARAYPMDHLMGANPRQYMFYESRLSIFRGLLRRHPTDAMKWVSEGSNASQPTLLHAMISGEIAFHARQEIRKKPENAVIFSQENHAHWRQLLSSRNPVFHALALNFVGQYRTANLDTASFRKALASEWLSLHHVALKKIRVLKGVQCRAVLQEYINRDSSPLPAPVTAELKVRAKSVLNEIPADVD